MPAEDRLAGIEGQPAVAERLRRTLETGHVAHAYAFVGPSGTGRESAALAFATALVAPADGVGRARAADRVARGAHPDVHLIRPTPPQDNPKGPLALRVGDIRELERLASLRPAEAPWKVFIVEDADKMTAATPQAFLKTLEEPPARTVIILILTQLRSLPPTVLSRCQLLRFAPVQPPGTVALLPSGQTEARQGALDWLAESEVEGVEAILRGSESLGRDREAAQVVVETCLLWYRDLLCAHGGAGEGPLVFADRWENLRERARRLSLDDVLDGLRACREAWQAIQGNVSPRLTVEVLLGRLALAPAWADP